MSDFAALKELIRVRVLVMLREPEIIFWVFVFPVVLAIGLGVAFADPAPEVLRVAVERDTPAEAYAEALDAHPELAAAVLDARDADDALRRGEVALVVTGGVRGPAAGTAEPAGPAAAGDGEIVLRFDPSRPEGRTARLLVDATLQQVAGAPRPVAVREEEVRQRGRRYIDWLIPGLIGFNLMSTGLWAVGFYVTQARQTRQLKRLVATPMRRSHFLFSQVLARFLFLVVEVPLLVVAAWLIFGVTIEGSPLALAVIILLGAACFSGFGLLASSRVRTTEGISGIINVILMPMLILSGVFFSPTRFPDGAQPFIQALPLTALNDALRAVYNDGLGLAAVVPELLIMAAWSVAVFLLALRWFRWQ